MDDPEAISNKALVDSLDGAAAILDQLRQTGHATGALFGGFWDCRG